MKRRIIVIIIISIFALIFITIGVFSTNKFNQTKKQKKCINNSDDAIKYIMKFYNDESSGTKYSVLAYNKGVYNITVSKDNNVYMYYTIDEKKCNISSSLIFGIKDEKQN